MRHLSLSAAITSSVYTPRTWILESFFFLPIIIQGKKNLHMEEPIAGAAGKLGQQSRHPSPQGCAAWPPLCPPVHPIARRWSSNFSHMKLGLCMCCIMLDISGIATPFVCAGPPRSAFPLFQMLRAFLCVVDLPCPPRVRRAHWMSERESRDRKIVGVRWAIFCSNARACCPCLVGDWRKCRPAMDGGRSLVGF
jgi:hypothetical protein